MYGTGTYDLPRGFSWQRGVDHFGSEEPRIRFSALRVADLPTTPPTSLDAHIHQRADVSSCVTPLAHRSKLGMASDRERSDDIIRLDLNGRRW